MYLTSRKEVELMDSEIENLRLHVLNDLGNTAWLRATYNAPLDVDHCGVELWSLWYNPKKLSVFTIGQTIEGNLSNWKLLASELESAFNRSVKRMNQR